MTAKAKAKTKVASTSVRRSLQKKFMNRKKKFKASRWAAKPARSAKFNKMVKSSTVTRPRVKELILVLDFGSQYTQLIARRIRENKVF